MTATLGVPAAAQLQISALVGLLERLWKIGPLRYGMRNIVLESPDARHRLLLLDRRKSANGACTLVLMQCTNIGTLTNLTPKRCRHNIQVE
jgi:hypothetical protein